MKLIDFLDEFGTVYDEGKVQVCREGLVKIRAIIESNGLRACCSERNEMTGSFDTVWTLTWAVKEWARKAGNLALETQMWHLMKECLYLAKKHHGSRLRDMRWKHLRRVAELAGITHYSFKKKGVKRDDSLQRSFAD